MNGQENVLNDIFRFRLIPKNLERQAQRWPKETQKEQVETIFATMRDVMKQRFIGEQSGMLVGCHLGGL